MTIFSLLKNGPSLTGCSRTIQKVVRCFAPKCWERFFFLWDMLCTCYIGRVPHPKGSCWSYDLLKGFFSRSIGEILHVENLGNPAGL